MHQNFSDNEILSNLSIRKELEFIPLEKFERGVVSKDLEKLSKTSTQLINI